MTDTTVKKKRQEAIDSTGFTEITVAVLGNVNASKSTTVGVLTNPGLFDDGRGAARQSVLKHPHEALHGQTSDISYQYYKDEKAKRIYTFVDLAGHAKYLKTTVNGLCSTYPDVAIVCISDDITNNKMTKSHLGLALTLDIPIIVLLTKCDVVKPEIHEALTKQLDKLFAKRRLRLIRVDKETDIKEIRGRVIPRVQTSNITGVGIELVRDLLNKYPKREQRIVEGFAIEHIYRNVPGYGMVITGITGININKDDVMYVGPYQNGSFSKVKIKTIHNDYRHFMDTLAKGVRGCLCLKIEENDKKHISDGMILTHAPPKTVCQQFKATVELFHHATTVQKGYQAFVNCGNIREPIEFLKIENSTGVDKDIMRTGERALVTMKFMKRVNYVELGQSFIFREGGARGFGTITELISDLA